jgi:hypothetical protein
MLNYMLISAHELDGVIRDISEKTNVAEDETTPHIP